MFFVLNDNKWFLWWNLNIYQFLWWNINNNLLQFLNHNKLSWKLFLFLPWHFMFREPLKFHHKSLYDRNQHSKTLKTSSTTVYASNYSQKIIFSTAKKNVFSISHSPRGQSQFVNAYFCSGFHLFVGEFITSSLKVFFSGPTQTLRSLNANPL